jgi:hypothetical protein
MQILGSDGPKTLSGTEEDDQIFGFGGDDTIQGLDGADGDKEFAHLDGAPALTNTDYLIMAPS